MFTHDRTAELIAANAAHREHARHQIARTAAALYASLPHYPGHTLAVDEYIARNSGRSRFED